MRGIVLGGAFLIFWWLTLLVVLPIGVRSPHEVGEDVVAGHDPGAPVRSRFLLKIAISTAIAVVLWGIFYALILLRVVDI